MEDCTAPGSPRALAFALGHRLLRVYREQREDLAGVLAPYGGERCVRSGLGGGSEDGTGRGHLHFMLTINRVVLPWLTEDMLAELERTGVLRPVPRRRRRRKEGAR
jgi:hypothetical protein